jgi:hypothetical protein
MAEDIIARLNRRERITAISLILLSVIFTASTLFFRSQPLEETVFVSKGNYTHRAVYSYTMLAKPSAIYDNRTTIHQGETVFIPLCNRGFFSLNYILSTESNLVTPRIKCEIDASLEAPGIWEKTYTILPRKDMGTDSFRESFTMEIREIDALIQEIEEETRNYLNKYEYRIKPSIIVETYINGKHIQDTFNPELVITLNYGSNVIEFEGLTHSDQEQVGDHQERNRIYTLKLLGIELISTKVRNMRNTSYLAAIISWSSLAYMFYHAKAKPPISQAASLYNRLAGKFLESENGYRDIKDKQRINLDSIDDLIKASEESVRPIVHHTQSTDKSITHNYYVIDEDIIYTYEIEEELPTETEEKETAN